jgi:hypothetical protein
MPAGYLALTILRDRNGCLVPVDGQVCCQARLEYCHEKGMQTMVISDDAHDDDEPGSEEDVDGRRRHEGRRG